MLHTDFLINAKLLDDQRLGKQRVEAMQILHILQGKQKGFSKHPIVKSWQGYEDGLKYYINCCIYEWVQRGMQNNMKVYDIPDQIVVPWWVFWRPLIMSHRMMMTRKDKRYVGKFKVDDGYADYGYIWPTDEMWKRRDDSISTLASPIPDYLIKPIYCGATLAKGGICGRVCRDGKDRCGIHKSKI